MSATLTARMRQLLLIVLVASTAASLAACGQASAKQASRPHHKKHPLCVKIVQINPNSSSPGKPMTSCLPRNKVPQGAGPQAPGKNASHNQH